MYFAKFLNPFWHNFLCIGANFYCCKWSNIKNNMIIWSHCVTLKNRRTIRFFFIYCSIPIRREFPIRIFFIRCFDAFIYEHTYLKWCTNICQSWNIPTYVDVPIFVYLWTYLPLVMYQYLSIYEHTYLWWWLLLCRYLLVTSLFA